MEAQGIDQNLLASPPRKSKKSAAKQALPEPGAKDNKKTKNRVKTAAYIFVASFSFFLFFLIKLPQDILIGNLLGYLSVQTPYFWEASGGGFRPLLRPHLHFEKLIVTPRFGDVSHPMQFETLDLAPNILKSLPWRGSLAPSMDFSMIYFGANASGSVQFGTNTNIDLDADSINLDKMPALKAMNIDLKGILSAVHSDIATDQGKYGRANGSVSASGNNIVFDPTSLNIGLPIPVLNLGTLKLQGQISAGHLQITRLSLGDSTHDAEVQIEGGATLHDPIDYSDLDLRIRFKLADSVMKAVPALEGMLPIFAAKRSDGFYGMKISGPLMGLGVPQPYAQ